ncbi:thioredoxin domain protein [Formosa agariphila KMM 3901]|uniref:Thioredoxin domain protein n=1 Tax=Formosa agariphila (strain DSM 15362 / KCTC 12365 / LMG 23005 / KMM 3901 / M-2Alg 35-1) TaxID=1347342 RepID=T2KQF1_FORAG|nr:thioredoxin fold domain-containing protein [Formosa agariphila]CDF80681.1 thioredoxin domain protein [Formosa agariphila KMM 3901]
MKKGLLLMVLMFSIGHVYAQEINWVSLNEALELQKTTPKKIMMDAYTNWCGPCKMLDKNTFQNKDVAAYVNENFYAVKFNAEGKESITYQGNTYGNSGYDPAKKNSRNSVHDFTRALGVNAYPTIVFFDESAQVIAPVRGYQKPQQLEVYLKLFKTDKYKELTSQEVVDAYFAEFVPEFVE